MRTASTIKAFVLGFRESVAVWNPSYRAKELTVWTRVAGMRVCIVARRLRQHIDGVFLNMLHTGNPWPF